jgi:hypothetical protein
MIKKKVPNIQKGQVCDEYRKTTEMLPKSFVNETFTFSSSEFGTNEKEDFDNF